MLNDDQSRAAEHLGGRLLVTAGAGSGKTRMLTERFANAVVDGRLEGWKAVDSGSVVAITYTEKAAGEIAERVRAEIGGSRDDLWISTIHGFCARILRRNPLEAGIDPLFSVADTVRAGRLRERAFSDAVRHLDSQGSGMRELLDAYGEGQVFQAVVEVARQLAVGGFSADAIALAIPPHAVDLMTQARQLFEDGTSVCDIEYSGKSTTHIEHAVRCRELVEECLSTGSFVDSEGAALERVKQMAERYEPIRRLAGFEDLREEMAVRKDALLAQVATALVAPHEQTMVDLVREYLDGLAQLKAAASLLDFEDLQTTAVRLLRDRPDIAEGYADRFKVVMIDEFQDTDSLQLQLVQTIAGPNLCTVGDEMQSIYRFRGADVDVYRRHRREMRELGALEVALSVNYRSHAEIIGFVNQVFGSSEYSRNSMLPLRPVPEGRPLQPQDAAIGDGPRVEVTLIDSGQTGVGRGRKREAAQIANRLASLVEHGMDPGDVAILLRAYTSAHVYAEALANRGIPAVIVGGSRFFDLPEIAVMRALTRVIANVTDDAALGVLLVSEFTSISDEALLMLRANSTVRTSLWESVCAEGDALSPADHGAIARLRQVIVSARDRVGHAPLGDVLLRAVEESGYDLRLIRRGSGGRDAFANVLKFARRAAQFEASEGSGPAGFARYLDDKERLNDLETPDIGGDGSTSAVRIMSIHASKGLEFPVVVVPDIGRQSRGNSSIVRSQRIEDRLRVALKSPKGDEDGKSPANPEWLSALDEADKDAEAQGDERLFYVALTRARDLLLVSGSGSLNPKARPESKNDLVKIARVLGRDVPIGSPCDEIITIGEEALCRICVLALDGAEADPPPPLELTDGVEPVPFGEPLDATPTGWLPLTVSYTQLSEFAACPRQFRVRRVLGIAPPQVVTPGHEPRRLGTALHAVLRLVSPSGEVPDARRMEAIARYFELDAEETRRMADAARRYCASDVARRVAEGVAYREAPLSLSMDEGAFFIVGSIDLYARHGASALIVDYKSGVSGGPDDLPRRYQLQADCYALAALRDGCTSVHVLFVRPEVVSDGLMERVSYDYCSEDAERIEEQLTARYSEIAEAEKTGFAPSPGTACANCTVPSRLCEHQRKESESD